MFSNKFYYLKFSITLAIIIGACLYCLFSALSSENVTDTDNIFSKYRKVSEIGDDYFTYAWGDQKITVYGNVTGIKSGDYVSFSASLLEDRKLKLKSFHVHKYRNYAMYLSILPVIVVFWILAKSLKWSKGGLTLIGNKE